MPAWHIKYNGVENLTLAVMSCVVSGLDESIHTRIGISLPDNGEAPADAVLIDGEKALTSRGENIANEFAGILDKYVVQKFTVRTG
jgi:(E)-4-hydroxy-3-methylbut-2-enyl-diphosphate synthase